MHYYDRHIGDYAKDTGHLSIVEHGAYTLLLDWAYSSERALPAAETEIFRLCRAQTQTEKAAVRKVVNEFFPVGPDGRRNKRVMEEIEGFKGLCAKNSGAAKASWQSRRNARALQAHSTGNASAMPDASDGNAKPMLRARVPVTSNHEPVTIEREGALPGDGLPVKVPLEMLRSWLEDVREAGADYTWPEVERAWRDFHSTRMSEDGSWRQWTTKNTPVTDYRAAIEDRIQTNRRQFPSRTFPDTGRPESLETEKNREKNGASGGALEGMSAAQARFKWSKELEELEAQQQSAHELDQPPDAAVTKRVRELREKLKGLA